MNSRPPAELSAETSPEGAARRRARQGLTLGLLAYISWGSFPAFFKLLNAATPLEVVSHRIFWSAAFLLLLVGLSHRLGPLWRVLRDRGTLLTLGGSTLLIAANWSVFILAVQRGQVLQSSLGYFMTPLISVLLGFLFLREKLTLWQRISVGLAALGVLNLALRHGSIPWIALVLATTFGLYGLLRKLARVDALLGLTIETLLLTPFALGYLIYLQFTNQGVFLAGSPDLNLLLPWPEASPPCLCSASSAPPVACAWPPSASSSTSPPASTSSSPSVSTTKPSPAGTSSAFSASGPPSPSIPPTPCGRGWERVPTKTSKQPDRRRVFAQGMGETELEGNIG